METALLILLLFTNWCWFVFFTSYRRTIKKLAKSAQSGL